MITDWSYDWNKSIPIQINENSENYDKKYIKNTDKIRLNWLF
jgi:hypothetical protein